MVEAVSCRPLTEETRVQSRASPCEMSVDSVTPEEVLCRVR
jgi:hypothetical protein